MLLQNIRAKVGARLSGESEAGFTLIELLVVMLILGILAAIALPAFFNQKSKAGDAKAKEYVHTAQVTMETCSTENGGKYSVTNCTAPKLEEIEPSLKSIGVWTATPTVAETGYTISVTSSTNNIFKVKNEKGEITFPCEVPEGNNPGGCDNGSWGE